jgi:hypothetical protein
VILTLLLLFQTLMIEKEVTEDVVTETALETTLKESLTLKSQGSLART